MCRYIYILMITIVMLMLTACAQDPWKAEQIKAQAEADQKAEQARQYALNEQQQRQFAADKHTIEMENASREQDRLNAVEPDVTNGWHLLIQSSFYVLTAVALFAIFMVGRNIVIQVNRVTEGLATAMITMADVRSRLIPLDPVTRQYPMLYQYIGHGRYALTDPNKKVTMLLDTRNEGDAQMIAGSIAIQHSGIVAMEARKSGAKDAASISLIQRPPIVEGTAFDVKPVPTKMDGEQ